MKDAFNRLLGPRAPTRDRRRSPRYPAVPNWACLAWHEGGKTCESGDFSTTTGTQPLLERWRAFIVCSREAPWASRNMSSAIRPLIVA